MNYEIIKDEKILREFIEWLPDLLPSEQYYLCLFARSKYCKDITHIKSDKSQLKRFISTKDRMFDKIRQLECPVGSYKQYKSDKDNIDIPQEALALYITPNPRDLWKATMATMMKMAKCIQDTNTLANPQAEAMSEIQKSKGTTHYVDFDIDESNTGQPGTILYGLRDIRHADVVNWDAVTVLMTRGGAHLLVDPKKVQKEYANKFYKGLATFADQTGDGMIPVPGCTQGGFIPHFINI